MRWPGFADRVDSLHLIVRQLTGWRLQGEPDINGTVAVVGHD